MTESTLFQDGCEIDLGDIVGECAISKDDCGFSGGRHLATPIGNPESERFDFFPGYVWVKACDQRTVTDGTHELTRDDSCFNGQAKVESQLEQQFVENVFFIPIRFDVIDAVEQRSLQIIVIGFHTRILEVSSLKTRKPEVCEGSERPSPILSSARRRRSLASSAILSGFPNFFRKSAAVF